jgi:hypothetical protein
VLTSLEAPGCAWDFGTSPVYPASSVCACLSAPVFRRFRAVCAGQRSSCKSQSLRLVAFQVFVHRLERHDEISRGQTATAGCLHAVEAMDRP